jgi:WD40 repeat protein
MTTSCPSLSAWQAVLDDPCSAGPPGLGGHLETCPACRQTLETLAAEPAAWRLAARSLHPTQEKSRQEPALLQVMEQLKVDMAPVDHQAVPPSLDFLSPAGQPDVLGLLGNYPIQAVLGWGGMGVVLKAFDPGLHRLVAIKVLAPHLASSAAARQRFVREARAAAAISHDHVLTIYAVEESAGLPYFIMPCVSGPSLQQKIEQTGPLPVEEIVRIGMQAAAGLAAAHAQGLVHRDVKPANILLENGAQRVKLTDFGLARAADDAGLTEPGIAAGTPAYMSPEQAEGRPVDARSDLFSLGSVLYAACTGRPPFRGDAPLAVLRQVSEATPAPIRDLNPDIPDWLEEVIMRLLAKDPAARPQTAAEVAALLEQHPARGQHPESLAPQPALAASPPRRRWPRFLCRFGAGAALVIAVLTVTELTGITGLIQAAATVLRLRTPDGTLVIEIDDPGVGVTIDDGEVIFTGPGVREIRLRPGRHKLRATRDGALVGQEVLTVKHGEKRLIRAHLEPNDTAIASWSVQPATAVPTWGVQGDVQTLNWSIQPPSTGPAPRPEPEPASRPSAPRPKEGKVFDQPEATWGVPEDAPACGVFTPDGRTLVTGLWNGAAVIWDFASGKRRAMLRTPAAWLRAIAVSADGKVLATGSKDGVVRLWDMTRGLVIRELTGHHGAVVGLVFAPDGRTLASVAGRELRLWDAQTGRPALLPSAFENVAWSLAFAPDGKAVAVPLGLKDVGRVVLVSTDSGKILASYELPAYGRRAAFSADGKRLAVGYGEDGRVVVMLPENGKILTTFQGNLGPIFTLAFVRGSQRLLTAGVDGTAALWDIGDKRVRRLATFLGHQGTVYFAALSPDQRTLVTGDSGRTLRLWNVSAILSAAPRGVEGN